MKKRILAVLLTIMMFACLLSTAAFAAEGDPTVTAVDLVYDGEFHELVSADVPEGYTMYYAMNTEDQGPLSTDDAGWAEDVPTARDAGTYYVWYYAESADGSNDTEIENITVTIAPMRLQEGELTVAVSNPPVYNGKPQEPSPSVSVVVSGESYNISPEADYLTDYADNVNAGEDTASVTVTAVEGGNYIFDDVTVQFSIKKATVTVKSGSVELAEASRAYDPEDYTAGVKLAADEEYVVVNGVKIDEENYETLIIRSVSGSVKYNSAGTQTVMLKAEEVEYGDGVNPDNYNEILFADKLKLTIDKAEITSYEAPVARELVENNAPQQLVDAGSAPKGATMYYRLKDDSTWKNSVNNIKGKDAETTYTVEYYIAGGQNYQDLGSKEEPLGSVDVTIASADTASAISGGSVAIVVAIAVIAVGAVIGIAVSRKKRSAN